MIRTVRWRLALWFTLALALIVSMTGTAVYLTTRGHLLSAVDNDIGK